MRCRSRWTKLWWTPTASQRHGGRLAGMGAASLLPGAVRRPAAVVVCGISVVLDPQAAPESLGLLRRMHQPIRHRGRDGEGFLALDRSGGGGAPSEARGTAGPMLGFAFRRLKILDLSDAAAQ